MVPRRAQLIHAQQVLSDLEDFTPARPRTILRSTPNDQLNNIRCLALVLAAFTFACGLLTGIAIGQLWCPQNGDVRRLSTASTTGVQVTDTKLLATVHVAQLHDSAIIVPEQMKHIWIEIGCSDRDTLDDTLEKDDSIAYRFGHGKTNVNNTFLISFEPLLDKWAILLARGNRRYHGSHGDIRRPVTDRAVPLGHHHKRGVVLPFAVAPHDNDSNGGLSTINVSRIAGCSSLMAFNEQAKWGEHCYTRGKKDSSGNAGGIMESRLVPTISITKALRLAPSHLPISRLKIDAQGLDSQILRAAAADLDRVYFVEIEVVSDRCPKLYAGQEGHTTVDAYMQSVGFLPGIFSFHGHLKCEGTGRFFRKQPLSS